MHKHASPILRYLSDLPTKAGYGTRSFLCEEPIHVHMGQRQKLPSPCNQCHTGIDITSIPTSLNAMRKVLLQG